MKIEQIKDFSNAVFGNFNIESNILILRSCSYKLNTLSLQVIFDKKDGYEYGYHFILAIYAILFPVSIYI